MFIVVFYDHFYLLPCNLNIGLWKFMMGHKWLLKKAVTLSLSSLKKLHYLRLELIVSGEFDWIINKLQLSCCVKSKECVNWLGIKIQWLDAFSEHTSVLYFLKKPILHTKCNFYHRVYVWLKVWFLLYPLTHDQPQTQMQALGKSS